MSSHRLEPFQAADHSEDLDYPGQIVDLLVGQGVLTREQVDYARRVQSKIETNRTLLDILKTLKVISDDQIKDVLRRSASCIQLGNLLVELGYIAEKDLKAALNILKKETSGKKLGEILVEHQFVDEPLMLEALSVHLGLPCVDLDREEIDRELFQMAPNKWYEAHSMIPVSREPRGIRVAFADPLDEEELVAAQEVFGKNISRAIAGKAAIARAIKRTAIRPKSEIQASDSESSALKLVDRIILAALEREASDIHIEPLDDRVRVRFRQDGVLSHFQDVQLEIAPALNNRIKVLCNLDITEKRRHQGGRFFFEHLGEQIDLRVSFYVTVHGEKIVLRLLNRKGQLIRIEDIGISPRMLKRFKEEALYLPSGVLLITGPTGSGKTSTVYSCIQHINNPSVSIITAEEPVEYVIRGIAQCSINPKINLTFEETLRHIVRQDPDVIVIGEIRDRFSAEVAVQAALTGHKVLTTFHTEDSIGGLIRLLNMNIEAFLISSTVVSVMAQRLLRQVCPACGEAYKLDATELNRLGYRPEEVMGGRFSRGKGCDRCQYTGYKGRIGVFELLVLNELVRDAIIRRQTSQEIRAISLETAGLVTLLEDGLFKAAAGLTTIEEVLRCLPRLLKPRPIEELRRLLGG